MPKLEWDKTSKRFYETGIDRGVLYLADNTGVPWNGLTGIQENKSDMSAEPIYFFGEKVNNSQSFGDYSATLNAYTYPDEFEEFDALIMLNDGLIAENQSLRNRFGLSYRTRVGNDVESHEHGYKIHIVYNLTAVPNAKSYNTLADNIDVLEFSWTISAVPESVPGYRPTAHYILDSTKISPRALERVEAVLYGSALAEPSLPSPEMLQYYLIPYGDSVGTSIFVGSAMGLIPERVPYVIIPNETTGFAPLQLGEGDVTNTFITGMYQLWFEGTTRLVETIDDGFYILIL